MNPYNQEYDALKLSSTDSRILFLSYYVVGENVQVLI